MHSSLALREFRRSPCANTGSPGVHRILSVYDSLLGHAARLDTGAGAIARTRWRHVSAPGPNMRDRTEPRETLTRALTGCLLCALILWTLLGNALVCATVLRFRHLRAKVTHVFIASLAVSDLLVAVLVMPWKATAEVAGFWPFGAFCDIWVAFDIMCSTASILNLCVISVDRYWAISSPFRYERKMTPRVAFVMIGAAWTLSVLISFIPVQLDWHKAAAEPNASDADSCDSSLSREYAISSSLVSFYIPVAIMIVTYTRIYRIAHVQIRRIASLERAAEHAQSRRSDRSLHRSLKTSFQRETKVLKTLSVIMGVFVCCWLPFFVLNCVVPFCHREPCVSDTTFDVFVWFGWSNSSLNPVIYAFNAEFRRGFSSLLRCRGRRRTPVETLNVSNELVSYNREAASACVNIIPHVVDETLDRISQLSRGDDDDLDDAFTPNGIP
ncbi:D(1) dopamine receptor-like [Carassius auratus]|uniref:D(1B) dopamine receptor n=1 Tax=Carassius auratus TaxID=7957 RepID=A0A6P6NDE2_CARAU|nr:D(1) dopamine receptor-like [Carassius auratus]